MKRKIGKKCLITFILGLCLWLMQPEMTVWAQTGKTSLAVSSGSVNIGDTVTVTARATGASGEKAVAVMTVSYDTAVFKFVSCSATYGGGGSSVTATGDSFTVTLKAVAAGDSKVSLAAADGVIFDTNEELESMSGSSTTISVKNAAGADGGNANAAGSNNTAGGNQADGGGTTGTAASPGGDAQTPSEKLSADNSLKVLALSSGTLSPAFTGSTVKYTASVPNDVTDLAVTATPVNEKAVVESVTGNKNLAVGENTVSVVVRAENGVTATYTIRVTRQAAGAADTPAENQMPDPNPEEPVEEEAPKEEGGQTDGAVVIDGVTYHISQDFTAEEIPADFAESAVTYQGTEYKGAGYSKGTPLTMLFLKPDTGEETKGKFFFYDGTNDTFYPYVKFGGGEKFVFSIPLTADEAMQAAYQTTTVAVPGEGTIQAYQENAEFYIFLALNQDGFGSYYRYDSVDGTYQRFTGLVSQEEVSDEDSGEENVEMEYLQQEYNELSEQYKKEKASARNVIAILVFVSAVLLIVVINLLIRRRGGGSNGDLEYEDEGDGFEEDGEEAVGYDRVSVSRPEQDRRRKRSFFSDELDDGLDEEFDDEPEEEKTVLEEGPSARIKSTAERRIGADAQQPVRRSPAAEAEGAEEKRPTAERRVGADVQQPVRRRPVMEERPATGRRPAAEAERAEEKRPTVERRVGADVQQPVRRSPAAEAERAEEKHPTVERRVGADVQQPVRRHPAMEERPATGRRPTAEERPSARMRATVEERRPVEQRPVRERAVVKKAAGPAETLPGKQPDLQSEVEIMDLNDL